MPHYSQCLHESIRGGLSIKIGNLVKWLSIFDLEDLMVDTYYYFDKESVVWLNIVNFVIIIKHISTRWLSLKSAVSRLLLQYPALRSYFLSQG